MSEPIHPWPPAPPPGSGGPEKVFCKDCRHRFVRREYHLGETRVYIDRVPTDLCSLEPYREPDPIDGVHVTRVKCRDRNANFDCALFERRPKSEPEESDGPPWWVRARRGRRRRGCALRRAVYA